MTKYGILKLRKHLKLIKLECAITTISVSLSLLSSNTIALSLEDYLNQVQNQNNNYQSYILLQQAGFIRSQEGFLTTSPHAFAEISHLSDSEPPISQALRGRKTERQHLNLGVAKKFETGTNIKLEYDTSYTAITNPRPDLVVYDTFWYTKPIISLEQPLIRDWLGKETKALIALKNSQAEANGHLSKFNSKKTIMDATISYWDLATTLANINIKQESVKRSEKLVDWAKKRADLGLGKDSDLLQAESALLQRKYELQTYLDMKKSKARLFNAFRNIQSDSVNDELASFTKADIKNIQYNVDSLPPSVRGDLKAKYQKYLATQSQAELAKQNITPKLNLNLKYYPSGRDDHYNHTASEAFRAKHNTFFAGVNFDMPLNIFLNKDLTSAYKTESHAALLEYKQAEFNITKEWRLLVEQYYLFKKQLILAEKIQTTQQKKLTNEEKLLKNGRTTTFQVLQFEQDLLNAQSQYYNTKNRLLNIIAAIELFK